MTRTKADPKEINRRKTRRRNAILNLVARRMGAKSWSSFGKQFLEQLYPIEEMGTTAQVNAAIKVILLKAMKAVTDGEKVLDADLQAIIEANPRLRQNW